VLNIAVGGAGNLHRDIRRHEPAFDGDQESLLAVFQQIANCGGIIGREVDLRGDFGVGIWAGNDIVAFHDLA